ncbi:2-amino-4-hydroxy-6-hydroxymethyldihydropteridine diphosphokinase [Rhodocyclus tenuis]|uniref:2-amino-4-hydroxy-6-hydroxymethyldihydropteridine pyrophosphokinase n=2 Tax=Rhodocyclus TaxID=1064 RepID=A0A6L5JXD7_RHOTE|nr:2-amino-4-hydroxy-6-hydroxymethyldihydropteridine diphosphokinase [Rhodocyclus gracilis]MQY51736.1 2-amino-4-hydroxy-6-hydroxymethyldihydropteridine diphosphokinase [Rhodocyclus gracilis]MRD73216.1 2-amino-4-hydroxy-6-hydroxymethyldihydropteridine diphosphokinase [Rhodocyclus gracilis]NJA89003.1 2-amino-4-hydroxy-6-hydroxymethyldihydropteridine diphosphokinase [Rhodocyclus gracilis]
MTDPQPFRQALVALGANLVQPEAQVRAAAVELGALPETRLVRLSSLYRTAPIDVGDESQPDYINAVALLQTRLPPSALLAALLATELRFGRRRDYHHAPRTLDLDLLLVDDLRIDSEALTLPHPRMHLRAFVIAPLLEIVPDCQIPGRGTAAAWLPAVASQRIEKLA